MCPEQGDENLPLGPSTPWILEPQAFGFSRRWLTRDRVVFKELNREVVVTDGKKI